jgi:hypothetical protein
MDLMHCNSETTQFGTRFTATIIPWSNVNTGLTFRLPVPPKPQVLPRHQQPSNIARAAALYKREQSIAASDGICGGSRERGR